MTNKDKPLLMEVNRIFITLRYDFSNGFDHREFYKAAIETLNHCQTLNDMAVIIDAILHFQSLHNDFVKLLEDGECVKFFLDLNLLPLKVNLLDECDPKINIVTNALTPDYRKFFVLSPITKGNHICYESHFKMVKTRNYYGKLNRHFFEIYDKSDHHLFSLGIKGNILTLIDNDCNCEIIHENKSVNVYHRNVSQLYKKDKTNRHNHCLASYQYKKIKHINKLGIIKYSINDTNSDKELLDLIAIGYLMLTRK